jgi:hypothetical protein
MAKFLMNVLVGGAPHQTARLAAGTAAGDQYTKTENGKFVKLTATSRYGLCAAGDPIQAVIVQADSMAQADGFKLGSIQVADRFLATCDGLQATPGTGAIAIGDFIVTGTVVAKDTALASGAYAKVCKATDQPGAVPGTLGAAGEQIKNANFGWRVIAFTGAGTGAVGDIAVCEKV